MGLVTLCQAMLVALAAAALAPGTEAAVPTFGVAGFSAALLDKGKLAYTQAGGHPYELAASITLDTVVRETPQGSVEATSVQDVRDIVIDLPPGVVGDALSAPSCPLAELSAGEADTAGAGACPQDTIVGHIESEPAEGVGVDSPLYNVLPEAGEPAELGYMDATKGAHVLHVSFAPTSEGYVLRIEARELPQIALTGMNVRIYGEPAAQDGADEPAPALLDEPADCTGQPLMTRVYMDSWQSPARFNADGSPVDLQEPAWASAESASAPVSGCELLNGLFTPTIGLAAQTSGSHGLEADSPVALSVEVGVPQGDDAEALATPPLRDATLALPEGLTVDPSAANGLQACSLAQVGISANGVPDGAPPACPADSQVGSVEAETPLLPSRGCIQQGVALSECEQLEQETGRRLTEATPLHGAIYISTPYEYDFPESSMPGSSLLGLYLVIDDSRTGVVLKLPAKVEADPVSGRLTVLLDSLPQLPFSALRLKLFGGSDALLASPEGCGTYVASTQMTPFSAPQSGPSVDVLNSLAISAAAGGGQCGESLSFAPSLQAGTQANHAGASSPLLLRLVRQDGEQALGGLSVTLPPGLLADLAGVTPCPVEQAAQGECGTASQVGVATLAAGAGPEPLWVGGPGSQPDPIYLTSPYDGTGPCAVGQTGCAPFGLAIVVKPVAGPFNLEEGGQPVVVRAKVEVNPQTAQLRVVADQLPQILAGVPLRIRELDLDIDRPGFIVNPTSCKAMWVEAMVSSARGASSPAYSRFQAAGCESLRFAPKLSASTQGNGRLLGHGASLRVTLTGVAGESNLRAVRLALPQRLAARIETIRDACPAQTFDADPAACPSGSLIGQASVNTPMLGVPLIGPTYLLSASGRSSGTLPKIVLVLQADGVRIDLTGSLNVSANNVTTVTFSSVPDILVRRLAITLPEGRDSMLAAGLSLCTRRARLRIESVLVGQNGARRTGRFGVAVSGCTRDIPKEGMRGR